MYIKAARGGHAGAQRQLGRAYELGKLTLAIDLQLALMWYQTAAEGGGGYAQDRLGEAYEKGEFGLVTDEEEALMWYKMAAEVGKRLRAIQTRRGLRVRQAHPADRPRGGVEVIPKGGR